MTQHEIAKLFDDMADLLEFRGENLFRIRAYRKAAQSLNDLSDDLAALDAAGTLTSIPGIGKDLASKIHEYLAAGIIAEIERLKQGVPPGLLLLIQVPGIGPKTAALLCERLHITSLDQLEAAAKAHKLCKLPGIQETKEQKILQGLAQVRGGQERRPLGAALGLARHIVERLRRVPGVDRIEIAGSLRRMKETIGDIDLLVTTKSPDPVMQAFTTAPYARQVLAFGPTKSAVLTTDGMQVDLRVVPPESFGAALQHFTGSKEHNVHLRELAVRKGYKLNEYGIFKARTGRRVGGGEEADMYRLLGMAWIPPELREDSGEIEAAIEDRLPDLVELDDIRGDFHAHTKLTDGHNSLEEMAAAARKRGYEYLAITDHSQSLRVARGLREPELRAHVKNIRRLNATLGSSFQVLAGSEVDILTDGRLDYPDAVLAQLDIVVGSVHSAFAQPEATMTARITKAIGNPHLTILGHPTGRRLGQRPPYAVNLSAVIDAAKAAGVALEMNSSPERLDLEASAARQAMQHRTMLAVSTDSHRVEHLDYMTLGVGLARRAWLEPKHLLNCLSRTDLIAWLHRKRDRHA
jgi:DNA polymerase (family 10)